jgi:hypothetical protein
MHVFQVDQQINFVYIVDLNFSNISYVILDQ